MSQKYRAPPITEAVIEIRYENPLDMALLEKAHRRLAKCYDLEEQQALFTVQVDSLEKSSRYDEKQLGYKLFSNDGTDILTINFSSFVVTRLAPYVGWPDFISRAKRDWKEWKKIVGVPKIERVGVRYINRIDIQIEIGDSFELSDYLEIYPEYPDDGGQPMTSYGMQVLRELGKDNCTLMINSGTSPSPLLDHMALLLDIDISREGDIPTNDKDLWEFIDRVRGYKNRAFEDAITEKSRELFS